MASENEKIADIIAEVRRNAESSTMGHKSFLAPRAAYWRRLAARLEAAAKREAAEVEVNAAPLPAVLITKKPENVNSGSVVYISDNKPAGNAATHAMTLDEAIAHAEDVAGKCDTPCKREHRQLADWLKELRDVKRTPVGNAAAMREALHALKERFRDIDLAHDSLEKEIYELSDEALSAPPRNCDVGTAEEQADRYLRFCRIAKPQVATCDGCTLANTKAALCEFAWAQMPYEEGGAA